MSGAKKVLIMTAPVIVAVVLVLWWSGNAPPAPFAAAPPAQGPSGEHPQTIPEQPVGTTADEVPSLAGPGRAAASDFERFSAAVVDERLEDALAGDDEAAGRVGEALLNCSNMLRQFPDLSALREHVHRDPAPPGYMPEDAIAMMERVHRRCSDFRDHFPLIPDLLLQAALANDLRALMMLYVWVDSTYVFNGRHDVLPEQVDDYARTAHRLMLAARDRGNLMAMSALAHFAEHRDRNPEAAYLHSATILCATADDVGVIYSSHRDDAIAAMARVAVELDSARIGELERQASDICQRFR